MKPRIMRAASRPTAKAEPANFIGTVLSDPVFAPDQPSNLTIAQSGSPTVYHTDGVGSDAEIRLKPFDQLPTDQQAAVRN